MFTCNFHMWGNNFVLQSVVSLYTKNDQCARMNQQFSIFYWLRSAYSGKEISSWSDILAVILFGWFLTLHPPENNNKKQQTTKQTTTATQMQQR